MTNSIAIDLSDVSVNVTDRWLRVYDSNGTVPTTTINDGYRKALRHVRDAIDAELARLDAPDLDQLRAEALDDLLAWFASTEPHDVFPAAQQAARDYLDARGAT